MKKLNLEWLHAAVIRAVRTMAQTALGMFTIGAAVSEINWLHIASVAAVSGVYSLLTSLATQLPELSTDGELVISGTDLYRFNFNGPLPGLADKSLVTFKVVQETPPAPSQE